MKALCVLLALSMPMAAVAQELPHVVPEREEDAPQREPEWAHEFYTRPVADGRLLQGCPGCTPTLQAEGGGEAGWKHRYVKRGSKFPINGRSRGRGTILVGIPTGSYGADVRVGSFWGPQIGKYIFFAHGPDLWFNFYGTPASTDFYLPPTPGLAIQNSVLFQPAQAIGFFAYARPGWVFLPSRHPTNNYAGLFHEIDLGVGVRVNIPSIGSGTIGYRVTMDAYGIRPGIILSQ